MWYVQIGSHESEDKTVPIHNICYGHSEVQYSSFSKRGKNSTNLNT